MSHDLNGGAIHELLGCSTGPGFVLNNVHARGPVLAYQNLWMLWKAPDPSNLEPKHLAFAQLIKPAPDLIIFGSGLTRVMPPRETLAWLRDMGTSIEILPTVRSHVQATTSCSILYNTVSTLLALYASIHPCTFATAYVHSEVSQGPVRLRLECQSLWMTASDRL